MKRIAIVMLSALTAFSTMPAYAAPAFVAPGGYATAPDSATLPALPLTDVRCEGYCRPPTPKYLRENRETGRWNSDRNWRREGWNRDRGFYRDRRYYRDHDYYRYRRHNNAGAIIGGLAAGAIIGGALSARPSYRASGNSHVNWCYSRYRSYRASDNTYQPSNGPRRQCNSPY